MANTKGEEFALKACPAYAPVGTGMEKEGTDKREGVAKAKGEEFALKACPAYAPVGTTGMEKEVTDKREGVAKAKGEEFALKACPAYVPIGTGMKKEGTDSQDDLYDTVELQ